MQSKSYVHVDDVIDAVLLAATACADSPSRCSTWRPVTTSRSTEIAELAVEVVGLDPGTTEFEYTGGDRGWKGDVPVVRLDSRRIRALGWSNQRSSMDALRASLESIVSDARQGRFDQGE